MSMNWLKKKLKNLKILGIYIYYIHVFICIYVPRVFKFCILFVSSIGVSSFCKS